MPRKDSTPPARQRATPPLMVRATISFLAEHHAALEEIARRKKVSLAWVVRDAAEEYVRRHAIPSMKGQR